MSSGIRFGREACTILGVQCASPSFQASDAHCRASETVRGDEREYHRNTITYVAMPQHERRVQMDVRKALASTRYVSLNPRVSLSILRRLRRILPESLCTLQGPNHPHQSIMLSLDAVSLGLRRPEISMVQAITVA
jgi:hypothetical protein